ncbi:hypothetical protein NCS52_01114600 [Fusarium sp. LHS14.1]|nr:hypothetical protein NCS52_01114600 [Fusarium sp. LHS14.1]
MKDLNRHKRTIHGVPAVHSGRMFDCHLDGCAKKKIKIWPRADNFRIHLSRIHGKQYPADDDLSEFIYHPPPSKIENETAPSMVVPPPALSNPYDLGGIEPNTFFMDVDYGTSCKIYLSTPGFAGSGGSA